MSNSTSNHSTPQNDNDCMDNSTTSADNEEYEWIPPRHIYALRDIIVENGGSSNDNALYDGQLFFDAREEDDITAAPATDGGDGDGVDGGGDAMQVVTSPRSESPPDDATLSPSSTKDGESSTTIITKRTHLISSQMVNISKEDNVKLIKMSRGAVLCSQWIDDDTEQQYEEDEERYEEEEGEDESNVETASHNNNNNFHTAVVSSSPQQVRICTTINKENMEEQVTVVPYSMARRRMGCNCRKNNHTADDGKATTTTNRKVRALNAVCTICQSVKRSFFRQFKRDHRTANNNKLVNYTVEEEYCKECNFFGDNSNLTKPKKNSWLRRQRRRRRRKRRLRNRSSLTARNAGMTIYGDEAVLGNTAAPSES